MDNKYLRLLAKQYPDIGAASGEIIDLNAICSLPKGTEYFFSDLHGEYRAFLHLLKSASGMIRSRIGTIFAKTLSASEQEALAALIYYPEETLKQLSAEDTLDDEWRKLTIYRLIAVCQNVSAKYSRSKVRRRMPEKYAFIIDELLHVTEDINRDLYYENIIGSILETGIGDDFIIDICSLIRSLCIDRLHIIGDIFDRGPRADIIMDELMKYEDIDIQWGNHDISWMGAASGNRALMANVVRIAISYNNFDVLEDGYGINLRALAIFAADNYATDPCERFMPHILDDNKYDPVDINLAAKMHKAIAVIQFKLESQLIRRHPEYHMDDRDVLKYVDLRKGTMTVGGKEYELLDKSFPTIDPDDPSRLNDEEQALMDVIAGSFLHSKLLDEHIGFLFSHGSMYKCFNNNLMFHGCIPMNADGSFSEMEIEGIKYSGRELMEKINGICCKAFFSSEDSPEKKLSGDMMWYLWCGKKSPLYGKDKMSAFERYFVGDEELCREVYNPYYELSDRRDICVKILEEFGLDPNTAHIINGHVPVKLKDGESPIKAGGKLFVIDGGISKAYQGKTGIAGYTLIYDSHCLNLAQHPPFSEDYRRNAPTVTVVEKCPRRVNISDTDQGREIRERISDLKNLLEAYRSGEILEASEPHAERKYIRDRLGVKGS